MTLLDFPDNILDGIYSQLGQKSICNLKLTCKYLNNVSNFYLLQYIYFYNNQTQMTVQKDGIEKIFKYTFIPLSKIKSFTIFIDQNKHLVNSIRLITFANPITTQIQDLVSLLLKQKPNLLECFTYEGQKLTYLTDTFNSSSTNSNLLYENDEYKDTDALNINVTANGKFSCFDQIPLYLSSLYIYNHEDTFKALDLNLSLRTVGFNMTQYSNSFLDPNLFIYWSDTVEKLKISSAASYHYLNQSIRNYQEQIDNENFATLSLFHTVKTLSITFSDEDVFNDLFLLECMNMRNVRNLEIQFKRVRFNLFDSKSREIVNLFNNKIKFNHLDQLAIVNLNNYNILTNNNIHSREIYGDANLCYSLMDHFDVFGKHADCLTKLNICLNTFVSIVSAKSVSSSYDNTTFAVNDDYLSRKKEIFNKLFKLQKLQILIIPDFLFNWIPFLENFKQINETYKLRRVNDEPLLKDLIRNLYWRFRSFETYSGLDLTHYPPYKKGHDLDLKYYFDLLTPAVLYFARNLPCLEVLDLGGFLLSITRSTDGNVSELCGVYDQWVFTNC